MTGQTLDGRDCVACGAGIPADSRAHRQTCSATCRQRLSRQERRESVTPAEVAQMTTPAVDPAPPIAADAARHDLAAIAAGIPTPADAYGLARCYCEVREGGFGVVFGLDAGRHHEPVGPVFRRPRQAIDLAEVLNRRLIAA